MVTFEVGVISSVGIFRKWTSGFLAVNEGW